jgi:crotonobetaine/carnitine-CoA ligase
VLLDERYAGAGEEAVQARIRDACAASLADFKRPVEIRVLEEFPRSTLEKVAKAELRRRLGTTGAQAG